MDILQLAKEYNMITFKISSVSTDEITTKIIESVNMQCQKI